MESETSLNAEQVELFLINHPDFFVGRDRLIKRMTLPHASGNAISLLERQNILLRTQTERLQHRLNDLLENARTNDRMFLHLQKIILEAVSCDSPAQLGRVLHEKLCDYFNVDELRLFLDEDVQDEQGLVLHARTLEPLKILAEKLERSRVYCGSLPKVELQRLFGEQVAVGSVAVARSVNRGRQVTLCLGSNDPDYYRNSMDTLFLNYLADITARLQVSMAQRAIDDE